MSDNHGRHPKAVCADCVILHTSKRLRQGVCSQEMLPRLAPWPGFAVQLSGPCTQCCHPQSVLSTQGCTRSHRVLWMLLLPDCSVTFPQGWGGESLWLGVEDTQQSWGCGKCPLPVLSHLLTRAELAGSLPEAEKLRMLVLLRTQSVVQARS